VASHAAGIIYDKLLQHKQERGVVLWLTPSETIRSQTLRALKDEGHPYRKALESGFSVPVYVMDNKEAFALRPDQVRDGLTIIVSTMQALKRTDKEGLKFYEDNGALRPHFSGEEERGDRSFSLFEVVRRDRPLVMADEGHNAKTVLALDLIESLDPSFVLELTATPLEFAYVLASVYRLSSPTAVEQLLGRVLRLPNVREKRRPELNEAYVYTSAEEFGKVLGSIVKGMLENGYGRDEVCIKDGSGKTDPYIVEMRARHEGLTIPLMAVEASLPRARLRP
jgi:hypothetical protein